MDYKIAAHNLSLLGEYPLSKLGVGEDGETIEVVEGKGDGLMEVIHKTFEFAAQADLEGRRIWVQSSKDASEAHYLSPGKILNRLQGMPDDLKRLKLPDEEKVQKLIPVHRDHQETLHDAEGLIEKLNEKELSVADLHRSFGSVDQALQYFTSEQFARLEVLDLKDAGNMTNEDFKRLVNRCPNLKILSVPPSVTGDVLSSLEQVPHLTQLDLNYCIELDYDSLRHLKHVPDLKSLRLVCCTSLRPDSLMYLETVPQLTELDLSECLLEPGALNYLQSVPDLKTLKMRECSGIEEQGLKHLKDVPNLEVLDLSGCDYLETNSLRYLEDVPNLKTLILDWCALFESKSLSYLKELPYLQHLSMKGCFQFEAEDAAVILELAALKTLNIGGWEQLKEAASNPLQNLPPQIQVNA